jgi:hypothetical protein
MLLVTDGCCVSDKQYVPSGRCAISTMKLSTALRTIVPAVVGI